MLDTLFKRSHHVRRLRDNPLGKILDQFVSYLLRRGHQFGVIHQFVRAVEHYGHWLGSCHSTVTADHLAKASARQFLYDHLGTCSCSPSFPRNLIASRAAINHLMRMLDQQDPTRSLSPRSFHGPLLTEYDRFLLQTCGLSEHTRIYRGRNARQFLDRYFGDTSPVPDRLRLSDVQDYFRRHAGHLKPGSVAVLASSLRSLFRFLTMFHGFDPALAGVWCRRPLNGPWIACHGRFRSKASESSFGAIQEQVPFVLGCCQFRSTVRRGPMV